MKAFRFIEVEKASYPLICPTDGRQTAAVTAGPRSIPDAVPAQKASSEPACVTTAHAWHASQEVATAGSGRMRWCRRVPVLVVMATVAFASVHAPRALGSTGCQADQSIRTGPQLDPGTYQPWGARADIEVLAANLCSGSSGPEDATAWAMLSGDCTGCGYAQIGYTANRIMETARYGTSTSGENLVGSDYAGLLRLSWRRHKAHVQRAL